MLAGDIVDQFLDDDRLTDPRTPEETNLSALQKRLDQIDDLHSGLKHLFSGGLLFEGGSGAVDRPSFLCVDRPQLVHRLTNHVKDAAERRNAHRDRDL